MAEAAVSQFLPDADSGELYRYDDAYEISRHIELIDDAANDHGDVTIPYLYQPREYQKPIWRAMFPQDPLVEAVKRAVLVWHRRAGKDKTCVNLVVAKMVERVGLYLYLLPKQNQARKVVWKGIGKDGVPFVDHFPSGLIAKKNDTDMTIEFKNGSIIQLCGSDNYDTLMGTNPVGIVLSEYSLQNPLAWDYFRPILAENDGWAIFEFTARGKNHGYFMHKRAERLAKRENGGWFSQLLTVDDTKAIPLSAIDEERESGMSEEMILQEFYCDFNAFNQGAVYGKQVKKAWDQERIGFVPVDTALPVRTFWDLGIADKTAIWLVQTIGKEVRLVGYYENNGEPMPHYFSWLEKWERENDVNITEDWYPHDIKVREYSTGKKREDLAREHKRNVRIVPNLPLEDGIEAVRAILARCWFDESACETGINCLTEYSYEYDEERKVYKNKPAHNWTSHGADAFRMMAIALKDMVFTDGNKFDRAVTINTSFNPFDA